MRLIKDHPNMIEGHHGCLKIIIVIVIIGGDGGGILLHVKSMATLSFLTTRMEIFIWVLLSFFFPVFLGVSGSSSCCSSSCTYVCV
jgi:hypothetical protein